LAVGNSPRTLSWPVLRHAPGGARQGNVRQARPLQRRPCWTPPADRPPAYCVLLRSVRSSCVLLHSTLFRLSQGFPTLRRAIPAAFGTPQRSVLHGFVRPPPLSLR